MSETDVPIAPIKSANDPQVSVYEMIREDIISARLQPNARLKVADLAAAYGTSANPVREALQQ
jgi:DNA-binding GntR family transcriptional regulator